MAYGKLSGAISVDPEPGERPNLARDGTARVPQIGGRLARYYPCLTGLSFPSRAAETRLLEPKLAPLLVSGERVSNPRPQAWEACALPTELSPRRLGFYAAASTLDGRATSRPADSRVPRRRLPGGAADLRHLHPGGQPHARRARRAGAAPGGTGRHAHAADPRRPRRQLAGRAQGQGRAAQLLGLLVRTLPGRGAAARAQPAAASNATARPCSA